MCGTGAAGRLRRTPDHAFAIAPSPVGELPPAAFDAVICRAVLHHVEPLEDVLRAVRRVLAPGGAFIATDEPTVRHPGDLEAARERHPFGRYGVDEQAHPSLQSVERGAQAARVEVELVVVDNGSHDGSAAMVSERAFRATLLALDANVGFPQAVNLAVARTSAEWILLLNNDATLDRDALVHLLEATAAPGVGAIAAQQRFAARPDLINSAGIGIDVLGVAYDRLLGAPVEDSERDCTDVFGASAGAALYRRAMLDQSEGSTPGLRLSRGRGPRVASPDGRLANALRPSGSSLASPCLDRQARLPV